MKKVFPANGSNLALRKKPGDRNRPNAFLQHRAIMTGMSEEPFSAPTATEEEGAQRRVPMLGAVRCQKNVQIIAGGFGVSKLKLNRLTFLHEITDGDGSRLLVCSHEVAH